MESSKSGHREGGTSRQSSLFIYKLYEMASQESYPEALGFSSNGLNLEIRDSKKIVPVLYQYFKHNNLSSFIRQLNNYGFRRATSQRPGVRTFNNPLFQKGAQHLLGRIARKAAKRTDSAKRDDVIASLQQRQEELLRSCMLLEEKARAYEEKSKALELENERIKSHLLHLTANNKHLFIAEPLTGSAPQDALNNNKSDAKLHVDDGLEILNDLFPEKPDICINPIPLNGNITIGSQKCFYGAFGIDLSPAPSY